MKTRSLSHVGNRELLRAVTDLVSRDRDHLVELLIHLAEVDRRRLYVRAGYASMFSWCVGVLRFSEAEAYMRIRAARAGRHFPAIFEALEDGRLHLSAVAAIVPHLTRRNVDEMIAAA